LNGKSISPGLLVCVQIAPNMFQMKALAFGYSACSFHIAQSAHPRNCRGLLGGSMLR